MKNSAYDTLFRVEDTLWWFVSRRGLYAGLLDGCKNLKILDAGCGTGSDMVFLREYGDVVGVDISKKALGYNRKRGNKVVQGDINNLPFKDDTFDLVLAGDCIYHQWVDDKKAIRGFYRVLKKGGCLIVNTAAYESLRSKHDEAVMTKKRYTKKSLRNLLIENDFKIQKIFYWNSILLPARILSLIFYFLEVLLLLCKNIFYA